MRWPVVVLLSAIAGSACTGADRADVADTTPPSERHRVFYLRNGRLGKLVDSAGGRTGVETADADCNRASRDRGLGGTWRAWLSSSEVDAIDRIDDVGPWYRIDRETAVFASKEELTTGPRAPIEPSADTELMFWSGTRLDGTRSSDNCVDWTIYNLPAIATVGRADAIGDAWVVEAPLECSNYLALLCIEQ